MQLNLLKRATGKEPTKAEERNRDEEDIRPNYFGAIATCFQHTEMAPRVALQVPKQSGVFTVPLLWLISTLVCSEHNMLEW